MTTPPRDFVLLLPPGWVRLPIDDRTGERVVRIVSSRVDALPAESREAARNALTRQLRDTLRTAAEAGGTDVFLSLADVDGLPVAASCLVTHLSGRAQAPLEALVAEFVAEGAGVSVVEVADAPAVRRHTCRPLSEGDVTLTTTQVDFFVAVPGTSGMLVLSFATAVEPLAEVLVQLFDAMAGSLRWVDA